MIEIWIFFCQSEFLKFMVLIEILAKGKHPGSDDVLPAPPGRIPDGPGPKCDHTNIAHCVLCPSATQCTKCEPGYTLSHDKSKCVKYIEDPSNSTTGCASISGSNSTTACNTALGKDGWPVCSQYDGSCVERTFIDAHSLADCFG